MTRRAKTLVEVLGCPFEVGKLALMRAGPRGAEHPCYVRVAAFGTRAGASAWVEVACYGLPLRFAPRKPGARPDGEPPRVARWFEVRGDGSPPRELVYAYELYRPKTKVGG